MHPEAEAFERAMLANPAERTIQLVYADWCDENGDEAYARCLRLDAFVYSILAAKAIHTYPRMCWGMLKNLGLPNEFDVGGGGFLTIDPDAVGNVALVIGNGSATVNQSGAKRPRATRHR